MAGDTNSAGDVTGCADIPGGSAHHAFIFSGGTMKDPPAKGDSHFYGRGTDECSATAQKNPSFVNEDPHFFHVVLPTARGCPSGTREVYRVFSNRADANHRYMTDRTIRDRMVALGWLPEGDGPNLVAMCTPA